MKLLGSAVLIIALLAERCDDDPIPTVPTGPGTGVCGNAILEPFEECDDGNTFDNDGCTSACRLAELTQSCGDRFVDFDEDCDDGNANDTDACIDCFDAYCGDGYVWVDEECCEPTLDFSCNADCTCFGDGGGGTGGIGGEAAAGGAGGIGGGETGGTAGAGGA